VSAALVDVEPPVRRSGRPRKSSWTEFEFVRVDIEPMGVFINKVSREIAEKPGPWDEL
jgi:hypothetical protein